MDIDLHATVRQAQRRLARFNNLSNGGCAVVAVLLGKQLAKYTEVRCVIGDNTWMVERVPGDRVNLRESASELLTGNDANAMSTNDWHDYDVHFGHVMVEFKMDNKWYHCDDKHLYARRGLRMVPFGFDLYEGYLELQEIAPVANKSIGWNKAFNRNQIGDIAAEIKQAFANPVAKTTEFVV